MLFCGVFSGGEGYWSHVHLSWARASQRLITNAMVFFFYSNCIQEIFFARAPYCIQLSDLMPDKSSHVSITGRCSSAVSWPRLYTGHKALAPFFFSCQKFAGEIIAYTNCCLLEHSNSKENPI